MNNLISSLLIFSLTSSLSAQNTLYVPDDFSSIQDGINGIQNGDTLIVRDGVYNENINFNGKAIEIRSENGLATTTLDGTNTGKSLVRFDSGESALSLLKGFTIKNGYPVWQSVQNGSGAFITGSSSPRDITSTVTFRRTRYWRCSREMKRGQSSAWLSTPGTLM